jgi:hypothetical protein
MALMPITTAIPASMIPATIRSFFGISYPAVVKMRKAGAGSLNDPAPALLTINNRRDAHRRASDVFRTKAAMLD